MLKVVSEMTIIDSMIFDDRSKLGVSSIHSGFQDDWSHDSESTDDSSLDNWSENSGLLDKNVSSFMSSISKAQHPLDLSHNHLHHNAPNSTMRINNIKMSFENNLKAPSGIKRRS